MQKALHLRHVGVIAMYRIPHVFTAVSDGHERKKGNYFYDTQSKEEKWIYAH